MIDEQHMEYLSGLDDLDWGKMAQSMAGGAEWPQAYGAPVDALAVLMDVALLRIGGYTLAARLIAAVAGHLSAERDAIRIWIETSALDTASSIPFVQGHTAGWQDAARELAEMLHMEMKSAQED